MTEPESAAEQTEQLQSPPRAAAALPEPTVASTARRQVFEKITHTLTDGELTNAAAVKMILDKLYSTEVQRDEYKEFVAAYYAAHEKAAVLTEKLRTNKMVEVFFGTGLALGGAAAGFVPYFWDKERWAAGLICLGFGAVLMVMAVLVRMHGARQ
jgi:hypothetical protein